MKIYAVREAGTYKFHGIFWAASRADLWDAVDEMGDPALYECTEIKDPGGIWHDLPNDETLDTIQIHQGEDEGHYLHPLVNTGELFLEALISMGRLKWTRFDTADVGVGLIARVTRGREG